MKTLIRLRGWAGWLSLRLDVHVRQYVYSSYGSFDIENNTDKRQGLDKTGWMRSLISLIFGICHKDSFFTICGLRRLAPDTINGCGRAHCGSVCVFLLSGFSSLLSPLLCFFTVLLNICVSR